MCRTQESGTNHTKWAPRRYALVRFPQKRLNACWANHPGTVRSGTERHGMVRFASKSTWTQYCIYVVIFAVVLFSRISAPSPKSWKYLCAKIVAYTVYGLTSWRKQCPLSHPPPPAPSPLSPDRTSWTRGTSHPWYSNLWTKKKKINIINKLFHIHVLKVIRAPFQKGLRLIASCTQVAIELRWISIVRLIATLCETGPWNVGKGSEIFRE